MKVGKTTFATSGGKTLLLACERGYSALPGVIAQDIMTWGNIKEVIRELKKPEVKEAFSVVAVDTIDIAGALCDKYICSQKGIENLGDGGWSVNGWAAYKKEFEETFRTISQLGYALIFISHSADKEFTRKDGTKYNQIVPTAQKSINDIAKGMADIYAYAGIDQETRERKLYLRSLDDSIDCGCRFKYIEPVIDFSYESLTQALNTAINKEAAEHGGALVKETREAAPVATSYDYDALKAEFGQLTQDIMSKTQENGPKIVAIVEKYLGKGKKATDTTPDQAEFLFLINTDLKDLL